jgi:hypothetical protein
MFENLPTGVSADPTAEIRGIDETATAFVRKVDKLRELVSEKESQLRKDRQGDVDRAGVVSTDGNTRTVDKDLKDQQLKFIERGIHQDLRAFRDQLNDASLQERTAMLNVMHEKLARLTAIEETYASPSALLAKAGLGSTQHANLIASLSGAGKAELLTRAREAAMTGDRVLASAVLTVNDRRARHERAFTSAEFAGHVIGAEHAALLGNIKEARRRVEAAVQLDRAFLVGGESPASKIERGLAARVASRRTATA